MVELPPPRKLGAPEAFIVVAALAVAIPLTLWWRGLYEPQVVTAPTLAHVQLYPEAMPESVSPPTEPYTVIGYMARPTLDGGTYMFPGSKPAVLHFKMGSPPLSDPNQTLMLGVGIAGLIGAIIYSLTVYPTLRR